MKRPSANLRTTIVSIAHLALCIPPPPSPAKSTPRLAACLLLCASILIGAQTAARASDASSLKARVEQLADRSNRHVPGDRDSSLVLAARALELAETGGRSELHVDALINMGFIYYRWSLLDSAQTVLREALEISREIGYVRGTGIVLNRLGNVLWLADEQAEARGYFERALEIYTRLGDEQEIGRSLNNLATVYRAWGDYERAIELFLDARKHYHRADYDEGVAWLDFSLTILHKKLGDYERALETIQASLETYRVLAAQSGDSAGVMICYGQLGDIYNLMDQSEQGLDYHLRALRMREETGVKPAIADGLSGVGKSYFGMGNYELALEYFQRSQTVRAETGSKRGSETNLEFMGEIYREMGRYDEAMDHFTRGLELARELQERDTESEILEKIADLHALQGRYDEAWNFLQQHQAVQESVMNAEISKRIASMQMQHKVEEQAAENEQLQRENRIKDLQLERSRTRFTLLVLLAVFALSGVAAAAYMQRKRLQIKILRGLIPICAHCKKIRNDSGYYEQLEKYISTHSDARFSHGICPECAEKYYAEYLTDVDLKKN